MSTYSSTVSERKSPSAQSQTTSEQPLASAWLEWQCQMVSGVIRGAVYAPDSIKLKGAKTLWPTDGMAEPQLVAAANQAVKNNTSTKFSKIGYGPNNQRLCDVIACPIVRDGTVTAIVSIAFSVRSEPQQQAVVQLIRWGSLWLDTLLDREQKNNEHQHEYVLALSASVARQPNVMAAAIEAVNKLCKGAACDRVSLGLRKDLSTRLKAISNTPKFDHRSPLVRCIEAAMEESSDQRSIIVLPSTEADTVIKNAHSALSKNDGHRFLLTVPLLNAEEPIGSLTFERDGDIPFDHATIKFLSAIARLLSSTLVHKIQLEKPLLSRIASSSYTLATTIFGKKYFILKLLCIAMTVLFFYAKASTKSYSITAPSSIEGTVRQLIAAPMDGYIKSASVRAGDKVSEGQTLAVLDNRKLEIELKKHEGQKRQITQQYNDALAIQDRTEIAKLSAQTAQIDSEIELVAIQLSRTTLQAPFDGVVISGDLSQALGAPVELGKVLFEVAPLESYRVVLEVPERDISYLENGQTGHLVITALPDKKFELVVDNISPLASANASGNFFQVEATLEEHSALLLPGMRGVTKISSVDKDLWWIWTHRLFDKVSLFIWSLGL